MIELSPWVEPGDREAESKCLRAASLRPRARVQCQPGTGHRGLPPHAPPPAQVRRNRCGGAQHPGALLCPKAWRPAAGVWTWSPRPPLPQGALTRDPPNGPLPPLLAAARLAARAHGAAGRGEGGEGAPARLTHSPSRAGCWRPGRHVQLGAASPTRPPALRARSALPALPAHTRSHARPLVHTRAPLPGSSAPLCAPPLPALAPR